MSHTNFNKQTLNEDALTTTPFIPQAVYDSLPEFLKDCTKHFTDLRERDVVLTSSLIILSGCFSSCKGNYSKSTVGPNLFGFITAPAASGKGVMSYIPQLASKIQKEFQLQNDAAREKYEQDMKNYRREIRKRNGAELTHPKEPKFSTLIVPGNSSSASIYDLLKDSDGVGMICETEADSLSVAIEKEWGNFSEVFRKAFHHEKLSLSRKGFFCEIENPCLSILLTGTPLQVKNLIRSSEDGLFSRFIYYGYRRDLKFINPNPGPNCLDFNSFFSNQGSKVKEMNLRLKNGRYTFSFSEEQFETLTTSYSAKVELLKKFEGDGAMSSLVRHGLITYRIAMLLSILREMDNPQGSQELTCSDVDFSTAISLTDVYFEHALIMYSMLPRQSEKNINPRLMRFYSVLPSDVWFSRKKAIEYAVTIGVKERSVNNYLRELTDRALLEKKETGRYKKNTSDPTSEEK